MLTHPNISSIILQNHSLVLYCKVSFTGDRVKICKTKFRHGGFKMRKFLNLNEDTVWTENELQELREKEHEQGIDIGENFEDWLSEKENDFEEIFNVKE